MGLFEAKGQLDRGMKDLVLRWNITRAQWHDNTAAEFEAKQLVPLQNQLRNAASAIALAAVLVARVRSECADR
jgi:hypothetical protein